MRNYTQKKQVCQAENSGYCTIFSISFKEDISGELGSTIPYPQHHCIQNNAFVYSWVLSGFFGTRPGIEFLNDVIARFKLTYNHSKYVSHETVKSYEQGLPLKAFQNLKSIAKKLTKKSYDRVDTRADDYVFWVLKLYAETIIKEDALIIYDRLESFAFDEFIDFKCKSTLRAKCRSIYNWYLERDWKTGRATKKYKNMKEYQELNMATRKEQAQKMTKQREEKARKKVLNVITGMFKDDYKKPDGSWNVSKIAKDSDTNRRTVMKYLPKDTLL